MTAVPIQNIRNFSIVAHIDHGKSTLADRLIQLTGGLTDARDVARNRCSNSMDIERERGITIKAQTVRLNYRAKDGKDYVLNLIDTPGHVDFAYEVNRSLAACEGSLLVVDASQGVEAQTLANVYHALDAGHEIVPVLNKVDLPAAEPDKVKQQIEDVIGLDASDALMISAKTGLDVPDVLEAIVTRLPPPEGRPRRAAEGAAGGQLVRRSISASSCWCASSTACCKKGQRIRMMGTGAAYEVDRVGVFTPKLQLGRRARPRRDRLPHRLDQGSGRHPRRRHHHRRAQARPPSRCPASARRSRWCSADCSRSTPPSSRICARPWASCGSTTPASPTRWKRRAALGFGFRCGFLGLLHLEIIQERLEREFNLDLIATAPSVIYKMKLRDGSADRDPQSGRHAGRDEDPGNRGALDRGHHPDARTNISARCSSSARTAAAMQKELTYVGSRAMVKYDLPLNEVVFDFYDRLKSVSKGYASFDYHLTDYKPRRPREDADPGQRRAGRCARPCWCTARAPRRAAAACARS